MIEEEKNILLTCHLASAPAICCLIIRAWIPVVSGCSLVRVADALQLCAQAGMEMSMRPSRPYILETPCCPQWRCPGLCLGVVSWDVAQLKNFSHT